MERQANIYICSTRRRKPGVCTNTLALHIAETDDDVPGIATMTRAIWGAMVRSTPANGTPALYGFFSHTK